MPLDWKLVVDCEDPHLLARFWERALGYTAEDPTAHIERLHSMGTITESRFTTDDRHAGRKAWRDSAAIRHPHDPVDPDTGAGLGRRLLFRRRAAAGAGGAAGASGDAGASGEGGTAPVDGPRIHLGLRPGADVRDAEVKRLEALGATTVREVTDPGGSHVTMADPEGNEFDVG